MLYGISERAIKDVVLKKLDDMELFEKLQDEINDYVHGKLEKEIWDGVTKDLDTFKEVADWIAKHGEDYKKVSDWIEKHGKDYDDLKKEVDELRVELNELKSKHLVVAETETPETQNFDGVFGGMGIKIVK